MKEPFLTGSFVYGTPHEDSDIDLVLWVENKELFEFLKTRSEKIVNSDYDGSVALKFGKINLLLPSNETAWNVWVEGTKHLKNARPVSRDQAVTHFRKLRYEAGLLADGELP